MPSTVKDIWKFAYRTLVKKLPTLDDYDPDDPLELEDIDEASWYEFLANLVYDFGPYVSLSFGDMEPKFHSIREADVVYTARSVDRVYEDCNIDNDSDIEQCTDDLLALTWNSVIDEDMKKVTLEVLQEDTLHTWTIENEAGITLRDFIGAVFRLKKNKDDWSDEHPTNFIEDPQYEHLHLRINICD